jgi:hypothetical protein
MSIAGAKFLIFLNERQLNKTQLKLIEEATTSPKKAGIGANF